MRNVGFEVQNKFWQRNFFMLNIRYSLLFAFSFLLTACVTINVYFPAAAAEKAADQIIDNVWGKEQKETDSDSTKPTEEDKKSEPKNESKIHKPISYWLTNSLNFFITNAQAGVNLDISTPTIQALQKQMANRHQELKHFYDNGAIGLTDNALITLRSLADVPLRLRTKVKSWVNEENQDRLNLYYQIATANGHQEWKDQIRAIFAKQWIERAQRGWWYQDNKGRWQRKR